MSKEKPVQERTTEELWIELRKLFAAVTIHERDYDYWSKKYIAVAEELKKRIENPDYGPDGGP